MFDRILNPQSKAEKWKGRLMIVFLLFPALSFWLAVAYIVLRLASGQSTTYEQAVFVCFCFGGVLILVWGGMVARAKMYETGASTPKRISKERQAVEEREQPEYLSTPKVPFVDFIEQADGSHTRQTRWLDSQQDVIRILEGRSMTANQIRLKLNEYKQHPEVKSYLAWRLGTEENAAASLQAVNAAKRIEGARVGESLDLTHIS